MKKFKGLSLFSNVGIAETYSCEYIDFKVANELIQNRADFYKEMYPDVDMIQGDILDDVVFKKIIKTAEDNNCDFIMATPPCQGMSIAGQMKENDPRNKLIIKVTEAIHILKPKYFLIENVPNMPKTYINVNNEDIKLDDYLNRELDDLYNINIIILNSKDYGTPQSRKRSFVLGSLVSEKNWKLPIAKQKEITVFNSIGHLPSLEAGETSTIPFHNAKKHNDRHIMWMKNTPTGNTAFLNKVHYPKKETGVRITGFSTTYKRMSWDKPCPTITMANGSISSQNNVHPGRKNDDGTYSDARVLTLKEIFLLTGLPDDWTPPSFASENLIRQVIGEGVPPKLIQTLLKGIV